VAIECPKCRTNNPDDSKFCKGCASPLPDSKDVLHTKTLETPIEALITGSTFAGRYQIIEELGKGGMGKVYRVLDKEFNEEIAIKLIKTEIAHDKKTVERFKSEVRLARKIGHKNVGKMYELLEEKGTRFITMEYVSGQDLKGLIKQSAPLSIARTILIAKQVCDGLAEAHRLGVAHRDLKPSNIMIDKEGDIKIMDFGIARSIKEKGITGSGVMIGTPEYMSPEQAEAKGIDHRSDIYSLGVILYEMLTGQLPFEGDSPLSIAMKHKGKIPKDPKGHNPQIPDDLDRLVLKCLEKEKDTRYQSAEEVLSDLEMIEKGLPTTDRAIPKKKPITSKEITVTFGLKKLLFPVLLILAATIIGLVIWSPWTKKTPLVTSDKPSIAILPFENISNDESLDAWRFGVSQLLITDLAQSKHLYVLDDSMIFGILRNLDLIDIEKYSAEDLVKIANNGGAEYIVSGSLIQAGEKIIITAKLQKSSLDELKLTKKLECQSEEEIIAKIDELSDSIKQSFDFSQEQIDADFDEMIGSITSRSPEAFKYYTEGVKRYHLGRKDEAVPFLEKTIEIDPQFAMAYNYLFSCSPIMGEQPLEYIQKAFELSAYASEREQLRIHGDYYQWKFPESEYPKAIEAYEKLLEIYPDDNIGNRRLGILYSKIEDLEKSYAHYKVNVENNSPNGADYYNMSNAYENFGEVDKAIAVMKLYAERTPGTIFPPIALARIYLKQQEYDLALAEVEKYLLLYPQAYLSPLTKGDIYLLMNVWDKAEKYYLDLLEKNPVLGRDRLALLALSQGQLKQAESQLAMGIDLLDEGHWRRSNFLQHLGYVYLLTGDFEKALEVCDEAWMNAGLTGTLRMTIQRRALYFKGYALIKAGAIEEAKRVQDRLTALVEEGMNKKAVRYSLFLEGMTALRNKDYSQAVDSLTKASSLLRPQLHENNYLPCFEHALFYDSLAAAYHQAGDLEKTEECYKNIHALTSGRLYYGDLYAKSFYMLGKIYEQQGNTAKAIEHYQKFLDLWKDADPGIEEVEDAKKRFAGMKQKEIEKR